MSTLDCNRLAGTMVDPRWPGAKWMPFDPSTLGVGILPGLFIKFVARGRKLLHNNELSHRA